MKKKWKDFSSLQQLGIGHVSMEHVYQGLDLVELTQNKLYYRTVEDRNHLTSSSMPVLYYLLRNLGYNAKDKKDEIVDIKKRVKALYQNHELGKDIIKDITLALMSDSKDHFTFIEFFIKEKMLDVNMKTYERYNLLMLTSKKAIVDKLIELGCDIEYKIDNPEYYGGLKNKTVYDYALKQKKKVLIKIYTPYIKDDFLQESHLKTVERFKKTHTDLGKLCVYKEALKENNLLLIDELYNNQETYRNFISYKNDYGLGLLEYAIKLNNHEVLKKLLAFDYYVNKAKNEYANCNTVTALEANKTIAAKILYEYGHANKNLVVERFKNGQLANSVFFKILIDDGFRFDLVTRMRNTCAYKIENESYNKEDVTQFFNEYGYLLNLDNIFEHYGFMSIRCTTGSAKGLNLELKYSHIKVLSKVLQLEEKIEPINFKEHFEILIKSIGNNTEKVGSRFAAILLNDFPEKEKEMIELFSVHGRKDWITKLNKENLEKLLNEMNKSEQKEEAPTRRMKI